MIFCALSSSHAVAEERNFNGHYELTPVRQDRSFSLDVKQDGSRVTISFAAAMADGSGAAPEATGKGHVEGGIVSFKFKDNFKNEGSATLELKNNVYQLSLVVLKVVDPSPFHFYGTVTLKQTTSKNGTTEVPKFIKL